MTPKSGRRELRPKELRFALHSCKRKAPGAGFWGKNPLRGQRDPKIQRICEMVSEINFGRGRI